MSAARTIEQRVALLEDQITRPHAKEVEKTNHLRDLVRELKIFNRNIQELTQELRYVRGRM